MVLRHIMGTGNTECWMLSNIMQRYTRWVSYRKTQKAGLFEHQVGNLAVIFFYTPPGFTTALPSNDSARLRGTRLGKRSAHRNSVVDCSQDRAGKRAAYILSNKGGRRVPLLRHPLPWHIQSVDLVFRFVACLLFPFFSFDVTYFGHFLLAHLFLHGKLCSTLFPRG